MFEILLPLFSEYELLDSGHFEKLERFGAYVIRRPEPQAVWRPSLENWRADAVFIRSDGDRGSWKLGPNMPEQWVVAHEKFSFRLGLTAFKHVGVFPEQAANWTYIYRECAARESSKVLNLFAYTGGATMAAAAAGAAVTHVDSVRQTVNWARQNMELSGLGEARWIVEDAMKFVLREVRRGARYDGIVLDPPAYGRGADGEKWVLEQQIFQMLAACAELLKPDGFLVLNLYSMGLSATLAQTAVRQAFGVVGEEQFGELCFDDRAGKRLPLGTYYRFSRR